MYGWGLLDTRTLRDVPFLSPGSRPFLSPNPDPGRAEPGGSASRGQYATSTENICTVGDISLSLEVPYHLLSLYLP